MKKLLLLLSVSIALAQNYSLSFDGVDDYVEIINDAPDANRFQPMNVGLKQMTFPIIKQFCI